MRPMYFLCFAASLFSQERYQADAEGASFFNGHIGKLKEELKEQFDEVVSLARRNANEEQYKELISKVKTTRDKIRNLEEDWRKSSVEESVQSEEPFAMWDVGETTLSQLIMEFGASDYLYVIPQELSGMKISLFSGLPLPHESWTEMIEMILAQNGIGAKKVNPFVKQLYILKLDPSAIEAVISNPSDLQLFAGHARLFYVFSPPTEQLKSIQGFFERFSDPKQTLVQAIGSKIAIVSSKEGIEKLLTLYSAVWEHGVGKVVKIFNLSKISANEAEKILKAVFSDAANRNRPTYFPSNADELITISLPQGLVLVGETETVERAGNILDDLQEQLEDPAEKVIHWYTCKHSDPENVASVLAQVYDSLKNSGFEKKVEENIAPLAPQVPVVAPNTPPSNDPQSPFPYMTPGAPFNPVMPASAPFVQPSLIAKEEPAKLQNFIVDPKTTSILMVVRRDELSKIKSLLKKLDVPKKMVQLDVLLVEKKLNDNREAGFSILQLGTNASGKKETAITYNVQDTKDTFKKGLFNFIFSKPKGNFPAADIRFNFLMTQEDVRIKANPSVLAINQTPAQISIVEEISINNGAFPINTPTGVVVEKSFTRAQYGITINLTPTIHATEENEDVAFVSLETDLEFDTTKMISDDDKPPVTRRHIQNQVRVADGETIILGGLRQKIEEDSREKIPFLGDIPGLGKLFGTSRARDISTEMFIFITPKIIKDPVEDLKHIREEQYKLRAGDIPEFLQILDEAKENERKKLFSQSLKTLFDMY